jgi:toxin ParE1/3/4
MAENRLSAEADRDLYDIAVYTLDNGGLAQAERYVTRLHRLLERLAQNPRLGVASDHIRPGYFRRRYQGHMIFYTLSRNGITVIRVLHGQADYLQHL